MSKDNDISSLDFKSYRPSWMVLHSLKEPMSRVYLLFSVSIGATIFAFLLLVTFLKFPLLVESQGRLVYETPPIRVVAPIGLKVDKLLATQGAPVSAGQTLLEAAKNLTHNDAELIKKYTSTLVHLVKKNDKSGCSLTCMRSMTEIIDVKLKPLLKWEISETLQPLIEVGRQYVNHLENQTDRKLRVKDLASREKELIKTISSMKKSTFKEKLKFELEELNTKLTDIQNQIRTMDTSVENQSSKIIIDLELKAKNVIFQLQEIQKSYIIQAPIDGTLVSVASGGQGDFIEKGTLLFEIIPSHAKFRVEIKISHLEVSRVSEGTPAYLSLPSNLATSPLVVPGSVLAFTPTTTSRDGVSTDISALITFNNDTLENGKNAVSLRPGLPILVSLVVGRERLISSIYYYLLGLTNLTGQG
jgi:hypothetical protein